MHTHKPTLPQEEEALCAWTQPTALRAKSLDMMLQATAPPLKTSHLRDCFLFHTQKQVRLPVSSMSRIRKITKEGRNLDSEGYRRHKK
jgi:hypothetical protein